MLSLHDLLSRHSTVLVIDSASALVQVGLFRTSAEVVWENVQDEAGSALFAAISTVLARSTLTLDAIDAFVFCEGPGSVLGIRTAAVSLRTWKILRARPTFSYRSLDLVAKFQLREHSSSAPFSVISDARRDSWHRVAVTSNQEIGSLERVKEPLADHTLLMPEHFRHWGSLPDRVRRVPYSVAEMLASLPEEALFTETMAPDAFLHENPSYQTWTPQVHRAPA